jgi:hypothetical protein
MSLFRSDEAIRRTEYDRLDPGLCDDDEPYCCFYVRPGIYCGERLLPERPYCEAHQPEDE